jgi:hypothetical protein
VPCTITFISSGNDRLVLHVAQSADEVETALQAAQGAPFVVNDTSGMAVHVNPAAIAFWVNQRQAASSV